MNRRLANILLIFAVFGILLYLLKSVLLPFVAGILVAYFLDPLADRLERAGCSRTLATTIITAGFFLAVGLGVVVIFPLLQDQIVGLAHRMPAVIDAVRERAQPLIERLHTQLTDEQVAKLKDAAGGYAGEAVKWVTQFVKGLLSGGVAVFQLISLLIITPLVSFYLLRDWDRIVERFDTLLPRDMAPTIREQMAAIDTTVAGWVRGQATVCLILGIWYGLGLTAVGLEFGLVVGFLTGLISFIPYFGCGIGLVIALGIALAQFGIGAKIVMVVGVFVVGQIVEGYFLTPRLVGEKVGLHPVWVIFALFAGGALFGFTGVLLAVPVAAVIGVLIRFAISRYKESELYRGDLGGGGAG